MHRISIGKPAVNITVLVGLVLSVLTSLWCIAGDARVASGASDSHFIGQGDFGEVHWSDASVNVRLYIGEGEIGKNKRTWLYYTVIQRQPFTKLEYGFGYIPKEHIKKSGLGRNLVLDTDTSTIPDFTIIAGSGGLIHIEWTKTSDYWSHHTGSEHRKYGDGTKYHSNGTWTSSSAVVQGSIIGYVPGLYLTAEMGKERSVSHTVNP